ncbi:pseudouridine synthase [Pseudogemmobacter bohemicus]|uniref:pseudouridine synthase n=1 Tax=Pseudogemmobacter bohemicus TaxID=2250708 RepID=UPI001E46C7C9|nr:pseudouridine synthase [Pseudogemmobacter bohemicus]
MPENTSPPAGERIAKLLSRRGVASRREAERLIEAGEVTVNGKVITSPALNVTGEERITVSGKALPEEEQARLWLYYKPEGLVTSAADEKGRDTVFDHLPEDLPRVMSVGRLDLNSEGLLLLTNDGGLKRRLELPSTGWLRKYRVRVNGAADDLKLQPLREGITVEGERFKPMQVTIDRQQGANAWLTVGLREGKNREIRRAMSAIGLYVNRLIRVSYGPFRLGDLEPGQVEEIKARVLREQLGEIEAEADDTGRAARKPALTRVRAGRAAPDKPARPAAAGKTGPAPAGKTGPAPRSGAARPASAATGTRHAAQDGAPATREARPAPGNRAAAGKAGAMTTTRRTAPPRDGDAAAPARRPGRNPIQAAEARNAAPAPKARAAKPRPAKPQSTRNAPPATAPRKPGSPSGRGGPGRGGPGGKG